MFPVRSATRDCTLRLPAHYDHHGRVLGFPSHEIIVDFGKITDEKIWAANVIREVEQDSLRAFIMVNPDVLALDPVMRKFVLAEEFLEVFLGFDDIARRSKRFRVCGKIELLTLFESMHLPSLWQDSPDDQIEIQRGLRYLLVSSETIEHVLTKEFGCPLQALLNLIRDPAIESQEKARDFLAKVESAIAEKRFVDATLVRNRMQEFLEFAFAEDP